MHLVSFVIKAHCTSTVPLEGVDDQVGGVQLRLYLSPHLLPSVIREVLHSRITSGILLT